MFDSGTHKTLNPGVHTFSLVFGNLSLHVFTCGHLRGAKPEKSSRFETVPQFRKTLTKLRSRPLSQKEPEAPLPILCSSRSEQTKFMSERVGVLMWSFSVCLRIPVHVGHADECSITRQIRVSTFSSCSCLPGLRPESCMGNARIPNASILIREFRLERGTSTLCDTFPETL